jgi:hypothetical protein
MVSSREPDLSGYLLRINASFHHRRHLAGKLTLRRCKSRKRYRGCLVFYLLSVGDRLLDRRYAIALQNVVFIGCNVGEILAVG